jgi:hypothetical protein
MVNVVPDGRRIALHANASPRKRLKQKRAVLIESNEYHPNCKGSALRFCWQQHPSQPQNMASPNAITIAPARLDTHEE